MADGQTRAADVLLMAVEDEIATLTLNRPEKLNALSDGLLRALSTALAELRESRAVKAVILKGAGRHFCAGHDLGELTARRGDPDRGAAYFQELFALCAQVMTGIVRSPQPVIAEAHGIATAAGCQLVASCDLAVAAESARFATPGVDIGLFCSTPMVALSRNVPRKHAMEMLLTGEPIPAPRAEAIGLVNRVVPDDRVSAEAQALARRIVSKSPKAVKIGKPAFYAQAEMPLDEAYAYAARVMAENMMARDAEEGIGAFLEKRAPVWPEAE
ncbi:MAG: enoyl-CoA hydratase [Pseudomonadota bacterium]